MISAINHINLSVGDLERSFVFYREVLGLKPLCRWPKGAYFLAGNDWICLNVPDKQEAVPMDGYTHYAFSVSAGNFNKMVERLLRAGVESFKPNLSEGDSFYFKDPDGHKLEIHVGNWQSRIAAKKLKPWPDAEFFV